MRVLTVEPGKRPVSAEIGSKIEDLQRAVGGYIEMLWLDDEAIILCNEEGKIEGLPLNRAIRNESGEIEDVIAGTFIIVSGDDDGNFCSLSEEQIIRFSKAFHCPETFACFNGKIIVIPG